MGRLINISVQSIIQTAFLKCFLNLCGTRLRSVMRLGQVIRFFKRLARQGMRHLKMLLMNVEEIPNLYVRSILVHPVFNLTRTISS